MSTLHMNFSISLFFILRLYSYGLICISACLFPFHYAGSFVLSSSSPLNRALSHISVYAFPHPSFILLFLLSTPFACVLLPSSCFLGPFCSLSIMHILAMKSPRIAPLLASRPCRLRPQGPQLAASSDSSPRSVYALITCLFLSRQEHIAKLFPIFLSFSDFLNFVSYFHFPETWLFICLSI